MQHPEKSRDKNELKHYITSLNETIADSQLFMRLMQEYLEEENEQTKKVLLAEMLLTRDRMPGTNRRENSTGPRDSTG